MPKPRKAQISLDATPYYHCVSRCVRRAFLCGVDSQTGVDYSHRRQWYEDRILFLASVFAVDVCAYAVMSNHVHVVLHVDRDAALAWGITEVVERWHRLFQGSHLSQRYQRGEHLDRPEMLMLEQQVAEWRTRLMDLSWYMRCLNESIARQANLEDGCTGRFWEGRFKCQALLDEKALAACLAYVDLNPVRANMADTPEDSEFTSIRRRIQQVANVELDPSDGLMPFAGNPRQPMPRGLPFRLMDYLELVDWTGRHLRDDKRGAINATLPPILERLQIDPRHWLYMTRHFESPFKGLVGGVIQLKQACQQLGYQRTAGLAQCRRLLG